MNDTLSDYIESYFSDFYHDVYNSLSMDEPADDLTKEDVYKLINIVHSMQMRFSEENYEVIVSGIIIHTALDHIILNGNKRLSLIFGYFCAFWYGHIIILMQGNFAKMIKEIVIEVGKESDGSQKGKIRLNAISALSKEIGDYSVSCDTQKIDYHPIVTFFQWIKSKL